MAIDSTKMKYVAYGEVYDWTPGVDSDYKKVGKRPVVIASKTINTMVMVLPLTSKCKKGVKFIDHNGILSTIVTEPMMVNKQELGDKINFLGESFMEKVDSAIIGYLHNDGKSLCQIPDYFNTDIITVMQNIMFGALNKYVDYVQNTKHNTDDEDLIYRYESNITHIKNFIGGNSMKSKQGSSNTVIEEVAITKDIIAVVDDSNKLKDILKSIRLPQRILGELRTIEEVKAFCNITEIALMNRYTISPGTAKRYMSEVKRVSKLV